MSLRFGVLGTGYWAAETHARGIAAHDGAELVGVWGRDPAKAEALARRFGVRGYEDLDSLLEVVDAVAIAVPPDVQAELAVRAAAAGRHLLLDKPLALSLDQARRVVDAVESSGVASVIFFTARFTPRVAAWLDELRAAGGWRGSQGTWFGSIFHPGNPYGTSAWRRSRGGLWDVGPHMLALAIPVLGPIERVTAAGRVDGTAHLILSHAGGATSTLSLTLDAPEAAETVRFAVHGMAGWSAMPNDDSTMVQAFCEATSQLAAVIADGGTEHPCDVRFGAEVVAVLDAAERVLASPLDGRVAPLPWRG